jgi:hypothetical protein
MAVQAQMASIKDNLLCYRKVKRENEQSDFDPPPTLGNLRDFFGAVLLEVRRYKLWPVRSLSFLRDLLFFLTTLIG